MKKEHNATKKKEKTYFENYDLYSDANPSDTIPIKQATLADVKQTIRKLERLYKQGKYPHKRISQVTNVMTQRARVLAEDERYRLSKRYYEFLKQRTRVKDHDERKKMKFKI